MSYASQVNHIGGSHKGPPHPSVPPGYTPINIAAPQLTLKFKSQTYQFDEETGVREVVANTPQRPVTEANQKKNYLYCLNCNKMGHNHKNCRFPTNSYGSVFFKMSTDNQIRYLMIQRKYTPAYVELLRAKYFNGSALNYDYLILLIKDLPMTERHYIMTYDFPYLRKNLWRWEGTDEQMKCIYEEYDYCHQKFRALKQGFLDQKAGWIQLQALFDQYPAHQIEPDWEFPKGHRAEGESDQQCAIRECKEETTLDNSEYKMFLHVKPFQEKFSGINQVKYCNSYYLAEINDKERIIYYDPTHVEQNKEIRKIGWFTEAEIRLLVNINHKHRLRMLTEVVALVSNLKKKN
jgi:8-oxo-dGTP pyrophosphatase MutT (NUDIX family)